MHNKFLCVGLFILGLVTITACGNASPTSWTNGKAPVFKEYEYNKITNTDVSVEDLQFFHFGSKELSINYSMLTNRTGADYTGIGVAYISSEELLFLTDNNSEENSGIVRLEIPVCYFDQNALLCIKKSLEIDLNRRLVVSEYSYYVPGDSVYIESKEYSLEVSDNGNISLYQVMDILGYKHSVNDEKKLIEFDNEYYCDEENINVLYLPIAIKTQCGNVWMTNGNRVPTGQVNAEYVWNFTSTSKEDYILVNAGEKYRFNFYCSWFPEIAAILFLDDTDRLISSISYSNSTYLTNQIIVVPNGATKMHFTCWCGQKYSVEKQVVYKGTDLSAISEADYWDNALEIIGNHNEKTTNKAVDNSKGHITFVIDDTRSDLDIIAEVFEEYGYPLCVAAITDNLVYSSSRGENTLREVCLEIQDNGGEILSHNAEVLTEELLQEPNVMFKHFYADKWMLESYGFDVNGIIMAGGQGQVGGSVFSDKWARMYYSYSDLYGVQEKGAPYFMPRIWIGNVRNMYSAIDDIIKNKSWNVYYFHQYGDGIADADQLREILEYIKLQGISEIEVVTYKDMLME